MVMCVETSKILFFIGTVLASYENETRKKRNKILETAKFGVTRYHVIPLSNPFSMPFQLFFLLLFFFLLTGSFVVGWDHCGPGIISGAVYKLERIAYSTPQLTERLEEATTLCKKLSKWRD